MTSEPTPQPRVWLPLPAQQVIYALSTDHYPWAEIWQDLSLRPDFSGVLEARSAQRRAQALWAGGQFLGAYSPEGDLSQSEFARTFPRALVRLYTASPEQVKAVWQQHTNIPQRLEQPWPQVGATLAQGGFSGLLLGSSGEISFWQSGKPQGGTPPAAGAAYILGQLTPVTTPALAQFWSQALAYATRQESAMGKQWESSAKKLAARHNCLDPFVREVWLEGQTIHASPATEVSELQPALLDVFVDAAQQARFPLAALKASPVSSHALYGASGLAQVVGEA